MYVLIVTFALDKVLHKQLMYNAVSQFIPCSTLYILTLFRFTYDSFQSADQHFITIYYT